MSKHRGRDMRAIGNDSKNVGEEVLMAKIAKDPSAAIDAVLDRQATVNPFPTDTELVEAQERVLAAIQEEQGIGFIPTGTKAADPFLAEDMTFHTTHHLNVVALLNIYLNDFRKANPHAALLQMIPTGPASFTFVWEL